MKKELFVLLLLLCVGGLAATVSGGEKYKSLRGEGDVPGSSSAPAGMDWKAEQKPIPRTFEHQPPLIPHSIDEYKISASENDCLDCHEDGDSGAPKPHESHFHDREGKETKKVASLWYFCTQCHVGQVDAKPLVDNTFQGK